MTNKLSPSSLANYETCPRMYQLQYIERLSSVKKGSALFFGSAIDKALSYMLENKDIEDQAQLLIDSQLLFETVWHKQTDREGTIVDIKGNSDVTYYKSDFDADLLTSQDFMEIADFLGEPGVILFSSVKLREDILKAQKLAGTITVDDLEFINLMAWLSLKRKGFLMLEAYQKDFLPLVNKVFSTQFHAKLMNDEGDLYHGYVDLICLLKDGRNVIIDNKTSSQDYNEDSVIESIQLGSYDIMYEAMTTEEKHLLPARIDACGYFVLGKAIEKTVHKECAECGFKIKNSRAEKCTNTKPNGKGRCGGEWNSTKTLRVRTQSIIDKVPDETLDLIMEKVNAANTGIKNEEFEQNFASCNSQYGQRCAMYNYCHNNGDMTGLIRRPDKKALANSQ